MKLREPTHFNRLKIRFVDEDTRTYTYTLEVSLDGENYRAILDEYKQQSLEIIHLPKEVEAKYLRIKGRNDKNPYGIHLLAFLLEYMPTY